MLKDFLEENRFESPSFRLESIFLCRKLHVLDSVASPFFTPEDYFYLDRLHIAFSVRIQLTCDFSNILYQNVNRTEPVKEVPKGKAPEFITPIQSSKVSCS